MLYSPDLNISTEFPTKDRHYSSPVRLKGETEVRRGFPISHLQSGRARTRTHCYPTPMPRSSATAPGSSSGKLKHAGKRPARSGGLESRRRRRRPQQPVPTPGRPPSRPPALTLGVRGDTDSPPPLREADPAPGATYLGVPAARPAGPTTTVSRSAPLAGDAASSCGPSDFQAAHFQAASRDASWEL